MRKTVCLAAVLAWVTSAWAGTTVTVDINGETSEAVIDDSEAGRNFLAMLPLRVTLSDSDNDFCGPMPALMHPADAVQHGYRNGELHYWVPGQDFVLFVKDEETSAGTGGLVKLGRLNRDQAWLEKLSGTLQVTVKK